MTLDTTIRQVFCYPSLTGLASPAISEADAPLGTASRAWLEEALAGENVESISCIRVRPWSRVFKVETEQKAVFFLKVPTKEFDCEASTLQLVRQFCPSIIPQVNAQNEADGSLLMPAISGETLRTQVRAGASSSTLISPAMEMGKLQNAAREHMSEFEQIGIPKWAAEEIIQNCVRLIKNSRFLSLSGLSDQDIAKFTLLFPHFEERVNELIQIDGGLSLEHGDFQDNNIFARKSGNVFMDWADASIAAPSFTIATYCHSILMAHPRITNKAELAKNILSAYYSHLYGQKYKGLCERHLQLVHTLYPIICVLKAARLFRLENKASDQYASMLVDYWLRMAISLHSEL